MTSPATQTREIKIGPLTVGGGKPIVVIAGPCVIESEKHALETAEQLKRIFADAGVPFIYTSSYDKANRSSIKSYRGPGIKEGLRILRKVKEQLDLPILSDIHKEEEVDPAAQVLDVLQIPAFLCRQTDLLVAAAKTGKAVNVKKGQFLAPWDMQPVVDKCRAAGNDQIMVCERGASFGYNTLVSDMRGLAVMRETGCPVVFDATHSVQQPGGRGTSSGGQREFVPVLARAAVAAGVSGVFMETHPDPEKALSDGPNAWPLDRMADLLVTLKELDDLVKSRVFAESELGLPERRSDRERTPD